MYLDIETIGTEDADVIADIAQSIEHPGNMSKADTIAKWEQECKPALIDAAVRKTSFDGTYGRVICVGLALDESPPISIIGDEGDLLAELYGWLKTVNTLSNVVGHNVSWDVRFLWQRYIVNNIKSPAIITRAARAKPWEVDDTMLIWNPDRDRKISLDKLCRALGVPTSKEDLDGSKVWDAYKAGEIERIAAYCRADVEAMRACYKRMTA